MGICFRTTCGVKMNIDVVIKYHGAILNSLEGLKKEYATVSKELQQIPPQSEWKLETTAKGEVKAKASSAKNKKLFALVEGELDQISLNEALKSYKNKLTQKKKELKETADRMHVKIK